MEIKQPTLLLDKQKCRANIERMVQKARKHRVKLIPHFKTHQSHIIGNWFHDMGIREITVSSVKMAEYFADHGWKHITIAFPCNILQIDKINDLANSIDLTLFVNTLTTAKFLANHITSRVKLITEIDTGYHRTGLLAEDTDSIEQLLNFISKSEQLIFTGFYTHSGNTYHSKTRNGIAEIHSTTLFKLNQLRKYFSSLFPNLSLSIGDTPGCTLIDNFTGISSIHPGNFVFYDINQFNIGSCPTNWIAVAVACPVVDKIKERKEIILHGGAVHFSKDFENRSDGSKNYGIPVLLDDNGWSTPYFDNYLYSLSQEHGLLKCTSEFYSRVKIGDIIGILPIHSCLTANLMKGYTTLDGESIDHIEGESE